jgi:hypothetical protein
MRLKMKKAFLFLVMALVLALAGSGWAAVFDVTNETELRNALTTAAGNGQNDTINIQARTYYTSGSPFSYTPNLGPPEENYSLTIAGANAGGVTIDGGGSGQVININTTGLTDDTNADITVTGITFQNGNDTSVDQGGGLHIRTKQADITVEHCEFIGNTGYYGGGAYAVSAVAFLSTGNVTFRNNIFSGNTADNRGGGAYGNCTSGTLTYSNNIFDGNTADWNGGGALGNSSEGTVVFTNNVFTGNTATTNAGGGAKSYSSTGIIIFTNNTFSGNTAGTVGGYGGGFYISLYQDSAAANIYNNIAWNNTTAGSGNDIYIEDDGNGDGTAATVNLYNNDYGPGPNDFGIEVGGGTFHYGNNITTDPLFVDYVSGDYHLSLGSPCVDSGTNNAPSIPGSDIEGNPRISDGNSDGVNWVDMGAFECVSDISPSPASHDFGSVNVGSTSAPQTFTFSNIGTAGLLVTSADPVGPGADMFDVVPGGPSPCPDFPAILTPGASCTLEATFAPFTTGGQSATLRLNSNDPVAQVLDIPLYGIGALDSYTQLTLLTPGVGEAIPSGSFYTIRWGAPLEAIRFKLKFSMDNGNTWKPIASGIPDTSYDWPVPTPKKNKKKCLVNVMGYDASGDKIGKDKSDGTFTIEVVKVTSPNGGETLTSGNIHTITWTTNETKKPVAKVLLKYTKNGGRTWKKITAIEGSNPETHLWTVPDVPKTKTKCKVKVVLKDAKRNNVGSDTSDGYFTIEPTIEPTDEELIRQMYQKVEEYGANEDLPGMGSLIHDNFLDNGATKADLLAELQELFAEAEDIQWDFDVREITVAGNNATVKWIYTLSFLPIGEVKRISETDLGIDFLRKGSDWKLYGNQEEFKADLETSFRGVSGEYQLYFAAELDPGKFPNVTSVVVNGPAVPGGLVLMQLYPGAWVGSVDLVGTPTIGEQYTFTVTYAGGTLQRVTEITGYFDAVPILLSPAEGATTSPTPTFVWEDSVPNRVVYGVFVVREPLEDVWEGKVDGTSAVYNFNNQGPDLLPGTYYWSVSALDWNWNRAISDERSFIVQ